MRAPVRSETFRTRTPAQRAPRAASFTFAQKSTGSVRGGGPSPGPPPGPRTPPGRPRPPPGKPPPPGRGPPLGGPKDAFLFYVLNIYKYGFLYLKMGFASALAWILFVVILIFTLLVFKSSPLWTFYRGGEAD